MRSKEENRMHVKQQELGQENLDNWNKMCHIAKLIKEGKAYIATDKFGNKCTKIKARL